MMKREKTFPTEESWLWVTEGRTAEACPPELAAIFKENVESNRVKSPVLAAFIRALVRLGL